MAFVDSEAAGATGSQCTAGGQSFCIILPHLTVFAATSPFANQKLKVVWAQGIQRQVYVGLSIVTLYIVYPLYKND